MKQELGSARRHPAALASMVIAGLAVTALALVTIAYLLGWIPTHGVLPGGPGSIATPGQQLSGTVPGGVDLLPGETLVTSPETPKAEAPKAGTPPAPTPLEAPKPVTPQYAKPAPIAPPPRPAAPSPSSSYAQVLPSRAAPGKPNYNREAPAPYVESAPRDFCVNCGIIASIGSAGGDWEVRVRFEDGSTETMRYADRPRFRIGERVHLEDGRLIPD